MIAGRLLNKNGEFFTGGNSERSYGKAENTIQELISHGT